MSFVRSFRPSQITHLQESPLFRLLKRDVEKGTVFPAFRKDRIDFYHRGGKLFSFGKNGYRSDITDDHFWTHIKYASVFLSQKNRDYVAERDLTDATEICPIRNFAEVEAFEQIKKNCAMYAREEASAVSSVYSAFSWAKQAAQSLVVLDIEVSFEVDADSGRYFNGKKEKQDRVDFVVLDKTSGLLRFVEAKLFVNQELVSPEDKPSIVGQIGKYQGQIHKRHGEIREAYGNYVTLGHTVFGVEPTPISGIDETVTLLVTGFNEQQKSDGLDQIIRMLSCHPHDLDICTKGNLNDKNWNLQRIWDSQFWKADALIANGGQFNKSCKLTPSEIRRLAKKWQGAFYVGLQGGSNMLRQKLSREERASWVISSHPKRQENYVSGDEVYRVAKEYIRNQEELIG